MRLQPFLAFSAACALLACGGPSAPGGAATPGASSRGGLLQAGLDDRPALVQNERIGDPYAAIAFAVARSANPTAQASVPALLRARLGARGFPGVRSRAHALGYVLDAPVASAAEAGRFVQALSDALEEPPKPGEPGLEAARAAVHSLSERRFAGPGEAAVAACSGELGVSGVALTWDPRSASAREELRAGLAAARSSNHAAFAAVGPKEVLQAVAGALADGKSWPSQAAPADAWPARDEFGVDFAAPTEAARRLSVALRVPSADGAVHAADTLGAAHSTLARRLAALEPPWRVERASAVARPRGACLRVDAIPPEGEPGPSAAEVARAHAVMTEELRTGLSPAPGAFDEAVLRPTDPGEAAAAAAWRALVARETPGTPRQLASYTAKTSERGRFDLAAALAALRSDQSKPLVELVARNEPGQARVFALLASTCGTAGEAHDDAGEAALVVSALARAGARSLHGVAFEPWIAGDGVGLLAHAIPKNAAEPARAQAERVAAALGELFVTLRPSGDEIASARQELLDQIGRGERRGYGLVLENLTQGHPSWLEPRGALASLESAPEGGMVAALQRFLARPLRLAVLANTATGQAEVLRGELERWLRPIRPTPARCPAPPAVAANPGDSTLKALLDVPEGSYLGLPFPGFQGRLPSEAAATLLLLNRSGGLLDQALSGLPGAASARALGGPQAGALVVQITASDGQESAAVARVRGLFERLAMNSLPASDVSFVQRELARVDTAERLDPRRRTVELWRGAAPRPLVDAPRLLRFHQTLRQTGALLVTVVPKT